MRAIFILSILIVLILSGCTTIEVAKEINKATSSIKTSIEKITSNEEEQIKEISKEKNIDKESKEKLKKEILLEKKIIVVEKKKEEAVVLKQNKILTDDLIGKTLEELNEDLGKPKLLREDGKTITARFDTKSCRIFVYFDSSINKTQVKYYELRNTMGDLIEKKEDIKKCLKQIKLA